MDVVDQLKSACEEFGGEFIESNTKATCEIGEDVEIVLNKKEGWVKYYQDGKLAVWGIPRDVLPFVTFGNIHGKHLRIEFEKPHIFVMLTQPKNSPFVIVEPPIEEPIIADEFKKEYYEKIMRLRKSK